VGQFEIEQVNIGSGGGRRKDFCHLKGQAF
jgi:hypothetical protein